jgi:hypothetical protein
LFADADLRKISLVRKEKWLVVISLLIFHINTNHIVTSNLEIQINLDTFVKFRYFLEKFWVLYKIKKTQILQILSD